MMETAVDILVVIASVAGVVLAWVWAVIWALLQGAFWLVAIILVGFFAIAILRPHLFAAARAEREPGVNITVESIRIALRSGELDAEIARVNQRNQSRRAK